MSTAITLRFYGRLNDFLIPTRRNVAFSMPLEGTPAIKDTIESLGVPHPEVERVLVQGIAVSMGYNVSTGDAVEVHPPRQPVDLYRAVFGPERPSFVADVHLGRLAAYLRMLGFDTIYSPVDLADPMLADIAHRDQRILLTRDLGLLKRRIVRFGYFLRQTTPMEQLAELVERYALLEYGIEALRCTQCNGALEIVAKDQIAGQMTAQTLMYYDDFRRCTACGKVYWRGSHHEKIERFINGLRGE